MLSLVIHVTLQEISDGDVTRLHEIFPKMDRRLARMVEDSVLIQLPGGDTPQEIRQRVMFCGLAQDWPVLPWVAYLGDSNYMRLLKCAVYNFRVTKTAEGTRHTLQKDMWERVVEEQILSLDYLAEKSRIPKRAYRTRRNTLQQYLFGDG